MEKRRLRKRSMSRDPQVGVAGRSKVLTFRFPSALHLPCVIRAAQYARCTSHYWLVTCLVCRRVPPLPRITSWQRLDGLETANYASTSQQHSTAQHSGRNEAQKHSRAHPVTPRPPCISAFAMAESGGPLERTATESFPKYPSSISSIARVFHSHFIYPAPLLPDQSIFQICQTKIIQY